MTGFYFIFKFGDFLGIIGGTPGKRISEGLFRFLLKLYIGGFYRHYSGGPLINVIVRVYFDVILFFDFLVGFYRHHRGYP